ncbi:unnamed protein product [marine sediment metagenome]|uniref:Uncharacterized protein n=1 Tax=marine sediment metagenome TaxID=412755 RepID=X1K8G9_9ZZZZ
MANGDLILFRVSADLGGTARRARPGDCRLLDETLAHNIGVIDGESVTLLVTMQTFVFTGGEHIGVLAQPLTAAYMPGLPLLETNFLVAT